MITSNNNIKTISFNEKKINIGIRILRVFLSFMVVVDHIYIYKKKYIYFLYYHIPTFFVISFYFTYNTLISFNINKIKLRFERLLIPYFSWCLISWFLINIQLLSFQSFSFKLLLLYFMNGHMFNVVLWFQNILTMLTIIFLIIIFLFQKNNLIILTILFVICYILLYTGINYNFFYHNFSYVTASTIGRLTEVFPFALTGFFLASINIINKLRKFRLTSIICSLTVLIIITKFKVFAYVKCFKYGGLRLNTAAICFFIIFSLFPLETKNHFIKNLLLKFTDFTGGIYFTHYLIGKKLLITQKILLIKNGNFFGCIINYIISYIICLIGSKLFGRTRFKHLFS